MREYYPTKSKTSKTPLPEIKDKQKQSGKGKERLRTSGFDDQQDALTPEENKPRWNEQDQTAKTLRVKANVGKGETGFTHHDALPTIGDDPRSGLEYKTTKSNKADVLQSDDGSLAINSAGQAQEFYAEPGMVDGWNQALEGNKTAVRLAEQKTTIDTPDGKLVQVKPTIDGELLADLAQQECFAVVNILLGKAGNDRDFQAIFEEEGKEDERRTARVNTGMKDQVGGYLNDTKASTDDPEQGIGKQTKGKYVGKDYGKSLGKGKLSERSKKLGVNEHAKGQVGDALVSYSMRAGSGNQTDYSGRKEKKHLGPLMRKLGQKAFAKHGTKTAKTEHAKSWEMHYAGIVAASADGADQVTLEDYNRADELGDMKGVLVQKLRERYEDVLSTAPEGSSAVELLTMLEQKLGDTDWSEARNLANKATTATGKGTWFMRMIGSKKGQTFHDQSVKSGDFVNPLTLRLGKLPEGNGGK